ncbi:hypothetical protein [Spongiimicrobium salis]|uniref:hypothetical protein n=1 Tax=Spongiimicrobium salis TaxID=1667022 RepID=UPI00374D6195
MAQNLKKRFEKDRLVNHTPRPNHEAIFIEKLYEELPVKKNSSYGILKMAAAIVVFISLGVLSHIFFDQDRQNTDPDMVLSTISPDLKEIEAYYVTNINTTLSEIKDRQESRSMVDRYMKRFAILEEEHTSLVAEIRKEGPSSMSIHALINNLKRQLELLQDLKVAMEELKNKDHEII